MKQELKKYPKMSLASVVYGNDDPTTANQVTQGLLQQHPNLKGIIATSAGIAAAAAVLDSPTGAQGHALTAGKLGRFTVGADNTIVLLSKAPPGRPGRDTSLRPLRSGGSATRTKNVALASD